MPISEALQHAKDHVTELQNALVYEPTDQDYDEARQRPLKGTSTFLRELTWGADSMVRKAVRHARMGHYGRSVGYGLAAVPLPLGGLVFPGPLALCFLPAPYLPADGRSPAGVREDCVTKRLLKIEQDCKALTAAKGELAAAEDFAPFPAWLETATQALTQFATQVKAPHMDERLRTSPYIKKSLRLAEHAAVPLRKLLQEVATERGKWEGFAVSPGSAESPLGRQPALAQTSLPASQSGDAAFAECAAVLSQPLTLTLRQEDGQTLDVEADAAALGQSPGFFRGLVTHQQPLAGSERVPLMVHVPELTVAKHIVSALLGAPLRLTAETLLPAFMLIDAWSCDSLLAPWRAQLSALVASPRALRRWIDETMEMDPRPLELLPQLTTVARQRRVALPGHVWALAVGTPDRHIVGDSDGGHLELHPRGAAEKPPGLADFAATWHLRCGPQSRVETEPFALGEARMSFQLDPGDPGFHDSYRLSLRLTQVPSHATRVSSRGVDAQNRIVGRQTLHMRGDVQGDRVDKDLGCINRCLQDGTPTQAVDGVISIRRGLMFADSRDHGPDLRITAHLTLV